MAKGFVRGMLQLLIWPLFRPSCWRTAMAALDLAPGFALADLSMRRADHRRLAAQMWFLWLCVVAWNAMYGVYPLSLAMAALAEVEMPVLAFLSTWRSGECSRRACTPVALAGGASWEESNAESQICGLPSDNPPRNSKLSPERHWHQEGVLE